MKLCHACNGSGEGMTDRSICYCCAGKGEIVLTDEAEDLEEKDFEMEDWSREYD